MSEADSVFQEEAREHLSALEQALLVLEDEPTNADQIALAFRAIHTIKGAGGMFGYDHLSEFTHHLESFLDEVRAGTLALSPAIIELFLRSRDHLERLLDSLEPGTTARAESDALLTELQALKGGKAEMAVAMPAAGSAIEAPADRLYRLLIKPHSGAFADGLDPLPVLRELRALGESWLSTELDSAADAEFDPEQCALKFTLYLRTTRPRSQIDDAFLFVSDDWQIDIETLDPDGDYRLGDLLVAHGLKSSGIEAALEQGPKTGELITEAGLADNQVVAQALDEQSFIRKQQSELQSQTDATVKVPARKLDTLMDLIGELVIVQARLDQLATETADDRFDLVSEELERLSTDLRDTAFDIRMLPIGTTFGRFRRLVRDLSRDLEKDIVLETEGGDTELDKMVIDRLADPLVHLIRNSIDHGIEMPEARVAQGKPARGHIRLSAMHRDGSVHILIEDDGAGLNAQKIRQRAIERGLIEAEDDRPDADIYPLIFEPGFSTAAQVSDISGRGVGMDVVKRSVTDLRGRIQLESEPGQGSTVRIILPMTLAIIEGLLVRVGSSHFVIPLDMVEECIEARTEVNGSAGAIGLALFRGERIPSLTLRRWFAIDGNVPPIAQTVVTRIDGQRYGLTVDEVIGQYQTVIKNMGRLYRATRGVMGATILGDGSVAMILDIPELTEELATARAQTQRRNEPTERLL